MDENDLAQQAARAMAAEEQDHEGEGVERARSSSDDPAEEDNFWNFTVQGAEVPLASSSGAGVGFGVLSRPVVSRATLAPMRSASADVYRQENSQQLREDSSSIHKTTHMANFYYKRSRSTGSFQRQLQEATAAAGSVPNQPPAPV